MIVIIVLGIILNLCTITAQHFSQLNCRKTARLSVLSDSLLLLSSISLGYAISSSIMTACLVANVRRWRIGCQRCRCTASRV